MNRYKIDTTRDHLQRTAFAEGSNESTALYSITSVMYDDPADGNPCFCAKIGETSVYATKSATHIVAKIQESDKPLKLLNDGATKHGKCPACLEEMSAEFCEDYEGVKFCPRCGQRIDLNMSPA